MGFFSVRHRTPSPGSRHVYVRKTVTKEKDTNWLWERPSRAGSVSSVSSPPRPSRRHSTRGKYGRREQESYHRQGEGSRRRRYHSGRYSPERHSPEPHSPRDHSPRDHSPRRRGSHHSKHHDTHHSSPRKSANKHRQSVPAIVVTSPLVPVRIVSEATPPARPKMRMEEVAEFTYDDWRKRETAFVATESTVAPKSSVSARSAKTAKSARSAKTAESDQDNTYHYVAMREAGPQDAVPVAYALYPQPGFAYMYPGQQPPAAAPAPIAAAPAAPVKQEAHYHHYTAERKEKSIRAASPPEPATQATMAMPYPYGMTPYPATAVPVAYAMPNYPVPVNAANAPSAGDKRVWVGRTKAQVDEDNAKIAHKEGVYKPNEIVPKGARPDQLFWVIEADGSSTLRTFHTIEDALQPGKWKIDPRYGNAYFLRDKKGKK